MKLEHHKQKVVPVSLFLLRLLRYALFGAILVVFLLFVGTMGYHFVGSVSWIDSFHMASMILTGMGPVTEMKSSAAKLFSSFYALYSGIAFLSISALFFAPVVHRILHILHVETKGPEEE